MLNGDVTIEKPQLKGIEEGGEEQWLIIFANGNTHIRNNSVNQDKPSTIHVFFYSTSDFEVFGVYISMAVFLLVTSHSMRYAGGQRKPIFRAQYIGGSYFKGGNIDKR